MVRRGLKARHGLLSGRGDFELGVIAPVALTPRFITLSIMLRVPVISPEGKPLMPTKASRARKWVRDGKAVGKFNDLGLYYIQLLAEPSDYNLQPIAVGVDPGKLYSGIGVQSKRHTLWTGHLELPFKAVKKRMENRRMLRRSRRGRRINRKVPFALRAHRQKKVF